MRNYFSVQKGFSFLFENAVHEFNKEFVNSNLETRVYFTNMTTGEIWDSTREDVYLNVTNKSYAVIQTGLIDDFTSDIPLHNNYSTIELNPKQKFTHERRIFYCGHLIAKNISGNNFSELRAELHRMKSFLSEPKKPSPSTVRLWMLQYQPREDAADLISGHAMRPKGRYRSHPSLIKIAFEVLKHHYFIQKNNKKNITRKTAQACAIEVNVRVNNLPLSEFKEIFPEKDPLTYTGNPPLALLRCPYISSATIKRLIQSFTPYERDRLRLPKELVKKKWQHSIGGGYPEHAFQYVELDHTVSDVYVYDSKHGNIIGRPVITFLIDSFSGYILSTWVSFDGENIGRFSKVIEFAYRDKTSLLKEFNLQNDWFSLPVKPLYMRIDNAPSQRSAIFYAISKNLGINPERGAVRTPVMKGGVENLMKRYSDALPQRGRPLKPGEVSIPGYNPLKDATIAFDDFIAWVFKWVVDVHNVSIPERSLMSPRDILIEEMEKLKGIVPVYPIMTEEFRRDLSVPKQCQVDNNGITLFTINYRSPVLRDLTYQISPKFKTEVRFDPNDMGSIFVLNTQTQNWITVPAVREDLAGKSLFWVKSERKARRQMNIESGALQRHLEAIYSFGAWQDQFLSSSKRKLSEAKKDARRRQVDQDNPHGKSETPPMLPPPTQKVNPITEIEALTANYAVVNTPTETIDPLIEAIVYAPL